MKKINTAGYHPQSDGLVEKFNSTLINMIAKCCETRQHDWDEYLPFLLFAYRSCVQESTRESPFCLLYGRDARLPTETALSQPESPPYLVDVEDYRTHLVSRMSHAWKLAQERIQQAQKAQKTQYDRRVTGGPLKVGDRVMVYQPNDMQGKTWKLARPYHGPYRIIALTPNNAEVTLVDHPKDPAIFVSLDRVRPCYPELGDTSWTGGKKRARKSNRKSAPSEEAAPLQVASPQQGPVTRSRARQV